MEIKKIKTVGIIGEGKMGSAIFNYLLDFEFPLRWMVSGDADLEKLLRATQKKEKRIISTGIMNEKSVEKRFSQVQISTDLQAAKDCDLIIEAVPEDVELKRKVFEKLTSLAPAPAIFASNSSSIIPSRLIVHESCLPFTVGMHFFYPVMMKETVELILHDSVLPEAKQAAEEFLTTIRRRPLVQNEANSFLLNRLWLDIQNEAFLLVQTGNISIPETDALVRERLFSFGVFDFFDSVGLDVMLYSICNYTSDYPHRDYFQPLISALETMVSEGKLGQKSGTGFYSYPPGVILPSITGRFSDIESHLRNTWLSASKRYTMRSRLPVGEMNDAIKDYFGVEKGPFE
jgi:3-hydroxybutyryl-CoA dehydrogenase